MLNPNSKKFKEKVVAHLLECSFGSFDDSYGDTLDFNEANVVKHLLGRFVVEANYANNRKRIPNHQDRLVDWLLGLAINVEYYYVEMRKIVADWYEISFEETIDKWADDVISKKYYGSLSLQILRLGEKYAPDLMRKVYYGNLTN